MSRLCFMSTDTPVPNLSEIRAALAAAPLGTSRAVSRHSGLAYDTVRRIARGERDDVRLSTLRKLDAAIKAAAESVGR